MLVRHASVRKGCRDTRGHTAGDAEAAGSGRFDATRDVIAADRAHFAIHRFVDTSQMELVAARALTGCSTGTERAFAPTAATRVLRVQRARHDTISWQGLPNFVAVPRNWVGVAPVFGARYWGQFALLPTLSGALRRRPRYLA